jgi:hypothetical protein
MTMTRQKAASQKDQDRRPMSDADFERLERARANLRLARAYGEMTQRNLAALRRQIGL